MTPSIEPLEHRRLYSISVKAGVMHINLGGANDSVSLATFKNSTRARYTAVAGTRTVQNKTVDLAGIKRINVQGNDGGDSINIAIGNLSIRCFINGGKGKDNIVLATHGNSFLNGGAGNDIITSGVGNDSIEGGFGDDSLFGGKGNDTIIGGAGIDSLQGGQGNDLLLAQDHGTDLSIVGGAGTDTAYADRGLTGDTGNKTDAQFKIDQSIETLID
ncbi:MAG TPA: calcium-binding protein [Tepidisphaeraceae bacterium]|jgi:Ca2+-binding RTX toxin-like protein|nr:calcium-binding protein [Tepidisphaeraceae bacterium]